LKRDGVEKIVENYINNKSMAQNISISKSISELVKKSGNNRSQRLFGKTIIKYIY
jgi:hypothetical protein